MSKKTTNEQREDLSQRASEKRINEILQFPYEFMKSGKVNYEARRDFLQLITEVKHLRFDLAEATKRESDQPDELPKEICPYGGCPRCLEKYGITAPARESCNDWLNRPIDSVAINDSTLIEINNMVPIDEVWFTDKNNKIVGKIKNIGKRNDIEGQS